MKKKKELCSHCGASMMANKYAINIALVRSLAKLAKFPDADMNELGFSRVQYSVYTKLKHWGLIQRLDDGEWIVTDKGRCFLKGEIAVNKQVTYFRDKVIEYSKDLVFVTDILPTPESKQKYRELMQSMIQRGEL